MKIPRHLEDFEDREAWFESLCERADMLRKEYKENLIIGQMEDGDWPEYPKPRPIEDAVKEIRSEYLEKG